jgi:ubiquinone biosynthesis protein COQ9
MITAASPRTGSRILLPIRQAVRCRRSFHAHDHPAPPGPFGKTESAILAAAYRHVPEHGFTQRALSLGARDVGLLDMSPGALVDGPFSLIRWHLITQRQALAGRSRALFEGENAPLLGVGRKVAALTWERLLGNKEVIHRWQEVCSKTFDDAPSKGPVRLI